jgi:dipeptidyl aminopeptidase/acylaminoacyl peptidase
VSHEGQVQVRVTRLEDHSTTWLYGSETLQGAVFAPGGEGILAIASDELLWFAYPEGTLLQRLSLASLSPVRFFYTGAQVAFEAGAPAVYFLGADANLYRWESGGDCERILETRRQAPPAFARETYTVASRDGRSIPVQRFVPPEPKLPALLYVHGGPNGAIDPSDPFMLRLLAEGIEFVCVAYRGSSGYGPEHEEANRGECGRADVWDILAAGFDWKKRGGGDRPLFIAGYSYGAFLTFLALAREAHPWAGGIGMWAVSGMHRMALLQHRAFPAEADELARARIERSPLEQAQHIRVPLLIFHGALDTTATTEEMRAIQNSVVSGGGACELVLFGDDTHGLMRHRDEIHERVLRFLGG